MHLSPAVFASPVFDIPLEPEVCMSKLQHSRKTTLNIFVGWGHGGGEWRWRLHDGAWICDHTNREEQSKFVVELKCVTKLVSPLSFYMASCFYLSVPLLKHSFEASLLGSSSLPIFVCMYWESLGNTCGFCCLPCGSFFALLGRSLQPASLLEGRLFFEHVLATHSCEFKMYPVGAQNLTNLVRHYNTLTTFCFVTSWSAEAGQQNEILHRAGCSSMPAT